MRAPSRTRWWCTAASASSGRIGARSASDAAVGEDQDRRAVRDRLGAPAGTAARRPLQARGALGTGPACSGSGERKPCGAGGGASPGPRSAAPAAASRAAGSPRALAEQVALAPTPSRRLITSSSRCGSMGGFVTCANSCLKYARAAAARSERAASGASLPIEPIGSSPSRAIGASSTRSHLIRAGAYHDSGRLDEALGDCRAHF